MADNTLKNDGGAAKVPPKLNLRAAPPVAPVDQAAKAKTVHIQLPDFDGPVVPPAAGQPAAPPAPPVAGQPAKGKTVLIDMSAAGTSATKETVLIDMAGKTGEVPAAKKTVMIDLSQGLSETQSMQAAKGKTVHMELPDSSLPASVAAASAKAKTVHIDLPAPEASEAPTLRRPAAGAAVPHAKSATMRINLSDTDLIDEGKPAVPAGSKKETSRIPLEMAKTPGQTTAAGAPKTIRLKPAVAAAPRLNVPAPQATPQPQTPPAAAPVAADAAKRKTSRISIEAVLGDQATTEADGTPKTIRLKRPNETATMRLSEPEPVSAPAPAVAPGLSKTARLDIPPATEPAETDDASPTRRKTIKIKRAPGEAEASAPVLPLVVAQAAQFETPVDRPHAAFIWLAAASLVAMLVALYVLAAHAFDNKLSNANYLQPASLYLPWPGRTDQLQ